MGGDAMTIARAVLLALSTRALSLLPAPEVVTEAPAILPNQPRKTRPRAPTERTHNVEARPWAYTESDRKAIERAAAKRARRAAKDRA